MVKKEPDFTDEGFDDENCTVNENPDFSGNTADNVNEPVNKEPDLTGETTDGETEPGDEAQDLTGGTADGADRPVKKGGGIKGWLYYSLLLLCAAVFAVCVYMLGGWMYDNYISSKLSSNLTQSASESGSTARSPDRQEIFAPEETDGEIGKETLNYLDLRFDELLAINGDLVGWIKINGTKVNYPIVQRDDNAYYLTRDFNKNYTKAGWIFADYRCDMDSLENNRNTIIYGHGRKDYSMFGSLEFCRRAWWYNDPANHVVRISTPTNNTVWQVFAVYTCSVDFYYIQTSFADDSDFLELVDGMTQRSVYDFKVDVTQADRILTLSTCTDDADRLVVAAKLVQID